MGGTTFSEDESFDRDPVDQVAEEFAARCRRGERPSVDDYVQAHPDLADALRRLLPAVALLERVKEAPAPGSPGSGSTKAVVPTQVGRYRVIQPLGEGGMGSVFLAEDAQLGRRVALKLLHQGGGREAQIRFEREARALAALDHPSVCQVHDFGAIDGVPYLVMAYIEGKSLDRMIPKQGLPPRQATAIVRKLAIAMKDVHAHGILHRDLKPSNVMLKHDDTRVEPIIVDFGLARSDDPTEQTVSVVGFPLGTRCYMPLEQLHGDLKAIGPASDVYALGVIFYQLLTGRRPFNGTLAELTAQKELHEFPLPSTIRPDLDPRLETICLKAMAREASDRYPTMERFADALASAGHAHGNDLEPETPRQSPWERFATHPAALPVASAAVVLLLVAVRYLGGTTPAKPSPQPTVYDTSPTASDFSPSRPERINEPEAPPESVAVPAQPTSTPPEPRPVAPPPIAISEAASPTSQPKRESPDPGKRTKTNSVGMTLVKLPAGEFLMGSADADPEAFDDERPRHTVRLSHPFYLATTEVTQRQYQAVTTANPSGFTQTDDLPVEQVTWLDAIRFCNALSRKESLIPYYTSANGDTAIPDRQGTGYRLPTEAEWEYACRAGSSTAFEFGDDPDRLEEFAWHHGNADQMSHPVGRKSPSRAGLFDMYGNVSEWCWDAFDPQYYRPATESDPLGPPNAIERVIRGGGWFSQPRYARSAARHGFPPEGQSKLVGFRVAQSVPRP